MLSEDIDCYSLCLDHAGVAAAFAEARLKHGLGAADAERVWIGRLEEIQELAEVPHLKFLASLSIAELMNEIVTFMEHMGTLEQARKGLNSNVSWMPRHRTNAAIVQTNHVLVTVGDVEKLKQEKVVVTERKVDEELRAFARYVIQTAQPTRDPFKNNCDLSLHSQDMFGAVAKVGNAITGIEGVQCPMPIWTCSAWCSMQKESSRNDGPGIPSAHEFQDFRMPALVRGPREPFCRLGSYLFQIKEHLCKDHGEDNEGSCDHAGCALERATIKMTASFAALQIVGAPTRVRRDLADYKAEIMPANDTFDLIHAARLQYLLSENGRRKANYSGRVVIGLTAPREHKPVQLKPQKMDKGHQRLILEPAEGDPKEFPYSMLIGGRQSFADALGELIGPQVFKGDD
ncbi:hypothetical protein FVE85_8666 [Porphyridium purpureum]|uniref:Uncharacterized protein n=1 Tax=Porphyridium purpureum TaxID=35688 RepID=A0A5J4YNX2_PORPP|nr:hypothetical protein FVE85_8666 [Porphyridium purpureum]|eukprot:POR8853..scf296_7